MWGQTRDGSVRLDPRGHARQTRPGDGHPDRRPGVDLRLLVPALFGWGATALTLGVGGGIRVIIGAVALVVAAWPAWLGRARHRRGGGALRMAALVAAVTGVLVATAGLADLRRRAGVVDELANRGGVGRVSGPVVAEPVPIDNGRFVVRLRAETVLSAGQVTRSSATMLVIGDDRWSHLQWRDHVDVLVRMRPADPGDSVLAIAKPLYGPTSRPASSRLVAWSSHIRGALRGAVSALPPDAQGLVPAMVFGDTSRSPPELTSDMRAAGLAHLSAVSGANVSILVVCAVAGLGVLGVRRRWRPAALLLVIAAFVVVTRPEPSVIRAAAMGGVGVLACYRSTRAAGIPALGAAIVGLLMADPWLARSFGFALSALATLGLLVFAGPWSRAVVQRFSRCPAPIAVAVVGPGCRAGDDCPGSRSPAREYQRRGDSREYPRRSLRGAGDDCRSRFGNPCCARPADRLAGLGAGRTGTGHHLDRPPCRRRVVGQHRLARRCRRRDAADRSDAAAPRHRPSAAVCRTRAPPHESCRAVALAGCRAADRVVGPATWAMATRGLRCRPG
ncbi:membrane hypothetical protein [Nostocoides australiense Ben110]|uniref:ComEC/Rec2-related protein domain-containing protein n=1 Tax=Nostocoides australiense Ben110 TaxID=1193182 RepID=W6JXR6_9MICO|nr:membrane hypothetical protein [Tetrasphaera australiensis Ben110]